MGGRVLEQSGYFLARLILLQSQIRFSQLHHNLSLSDFNKKTDCIKQSVFLCHEMRYLKKSQDIMQKVCKKIGHIKNRKSLFRKGNIILQTQKNMRKKIKTRLFALLSTIILCIFLCMPVFADNYTAGYDSAFNISETTKSVEITITYENKPDITITSPSEMVFFVTQEDFDKHGVAINYEIVDEKSSRLYITDGEIGTWHLFSTGPISLSIVTQEVENIDIMPQDTGDVASDGENVNTTDISTTGQTDGTGTSQTERTLKIIVKLLPVIMIGVAVVAVLIALVAILSHKKHPRRKPQIGTIHAKRSSGAIEEQEIVNPVQPEDEMVEPYEPILDEDSDIREHAARTEEDVAEKNIQKKKSLFERKSHKEKTVKKEKPTKKEKPPKKEKPAANAETDDVEVIPEITPEMEMEMIRKKADEMWSKYESEIKKVENQDEKEKQKYTAYTEEVQYITQEDLDNDVTIEEYIGETEEPEPDPRWNTGKKMDADKFDSMMNKKKKSFFTDDRFGD